MRIYLLFVGVIFALIGKAQTPTMNCSSDIIVGNDPGFCGAVVTYTAPTCATNCTGTTITQTDATGLSSGSSFPLDTTILEYTITNGVESSTCSFMVIVQDTETPTFTPLCPSDISVNNDPGVCGAAVTYNRPKGVDNCGTPATIQTDGTGLSSTMTFPIGVTPQVFECVDTAGNVATCSFNITVVDVEGPVISSYDTVQVFGNNTGICGGTANYTMPIASDNCGGTVTFTQIDASGYTNSDVFPGGVTVQQYVSVDATGNYGDTATMYIGIQDTTLPVISCPGNQVQYLNVNCESWLLDYTSFGVASDNCDSIVITQNPTPGTIFTGAGTTVTVGLMATDTSGNFTQCFFDVTLLDTLAPSITCVTDQNVTASSGCDAILQDYTGVVTTSDNCDSNPIVTQNPTAGTVITTSQLVWVYSTDASDNVDSCSFTVVVDDPVAPTVICPNDSTVYNDATCSYTVPDFTSLVVASDNCDSNPTVTQSPSAGSVIPGGTTQFISFEVTDISGNSSFCSFLLDVVDTIGPNLICVPDQIVYVDNLCEATLADYTGIVTATDNCSGSVFVSQNPTAGTIFSTVGPQSVTITAQDNKGNTSNCTFTVTFTDTIAPTIITCANDTTVSADNNCEYLMGDFTGFVTALDSCTSVITYSQSISTGTSITVGATVSLSLYAEDQSGNIDSCMIDITVVDDVPPVLNCPLNPSVPANNSCEYVIPDYQSELNIVDNCDPSISYSQSISSGTIVSGIGSQQTILIFVSDVSGNNNSCSFTITVADTTAPTIVCPSDTLLDIDANCQYVLPDLTSGALVSDYCDGSPSIFQNPSIGVTLSGVVPITLTVQDVSGNSATCQFNTIANDTVDPTISCPADFATCDSLIEYQVPVGIDDCGVPTTSQIDISGYTTGTVFPIGQTVQTYKVVDGLNNFATCSFIITRYAPVFVNAGSDTLIEEGSTINLNGSATTGSSYSWSPTYGLDDPSVLNPSLTPSASVEYYLTASNSDGCSATDSVTIVVNTVNDLEINNFISPNGDGKNDTWNMNKPSLISGCQVTIFNTWGKVVWNSSAYANDWDGTNLNGEALPEGTYFYTISNCQGYDTEGSIMLMR